VTHGLPFSILSRRTELRLGDGRSSRRCEKVELKGFRYLDVRKSTRDVRGAVDSSHEPYV
jgi:hypothetical protein